MGAAAAAADDAVLAGYFEVKLAGLDTIKFTDVSGLNHTVSISSAPVGSTTGAAADSRTISPPEPITLSMSHVVITDMMVFTWLKTTIDTKADPQQAKEGTLSIMPMGGTQTPLKTWNLKDVYITGLSLDAMGAGALSHLTATLQLLVGECKPM